MEDSKLNTEEIKKYKCLVCDRLFRTTKEVRVCSVCKLTYDATFYWSDGRQDQKKYGDLGVWEKEGK